MAESGVNIKVVQDIPGHKDIATTLDICIDVAKELSKREFGNLEEKLKDNRMSVEIENADEEYKEESGSFRIMQ